MVYLTYQNNASQWELTGIFIKLPKAKKFIRENSYYHDLPIRAMPYILEIETDKRIAWTKKWKYTKNKEFTEVRY